MNKCTLVVAIAALLVAVLKPQGTEARMTLPQVRNAMKGMAKTCYAKTGVDPAVASAAKDGQFPRERTLMCYFLCMYSGMKVVKDGKLNLDALFKQVDMIMPLDMGPKVKDMTAQCAASTTTDDDCERFYEIAKCYWEIDSTAWLFP